MKGSVLMLLPFLAACDSFIAPEDGPAPAINSSRVATRLARDIVGQDFRLAVDTVGLIDVVTGVGAETQYGSRCMLSIVVVTTSSFRASTSPTQALPGRYRPMDNSEPGNQRLLSTGDSPLSKGIARTLFSKTG